MKKELISVIIPCYNVSKYVSKCLDSIINQTYKNLEIILVEDCSTDNTYEILKEYEKKDKRIKLIKNNENGGLSHARNVGIKNSNGNYIGFIDSDDYVDLDFYEKLMSSIIEEKSEVAIADIKIMDDETGAQTLSKCYVDNTFSLVNVLKDGLAASACNKLFKKELLSKYEFAEGKINEDLAVVIPALVNAKKISNIEGSNYYYIQRNNSIQNSSFSDKRFDIFVGLDTTLERLKGCKDYDEIYDALVYTQIIALLLFVIPKEKNNKKRKQILKKYNELSSKYNIKNNRNFDNYIKSIGKKHQIYYKTLVKLNCSKHYTLANSLINLYNKMYSVLKKPVIDKNIGLNKLVECAKKQSNMTDEKIKVSVIVPNYNYARFMYQRLYSILNQNYKIYELIILDDKSSDNSIEVIDEIVNNIKDYINVKTIYNEKNSGSAFKQWQRGFDEATGDYVWIAEADDYCESNLIRKLVEPINRNDNIMISYCDTSFIDVNGSINIKTIKPEIDIQKSGHWNNSYVNNGIDEIKNYSFLNNTIANVSSCIIKNGDYKSIFIEAGKYHQAGDWLIYLEVMAQGDISYIDIPLNYYRLHGNNVSSTTKYTSHLKELEKIYAMLIDKYKLDENCISKIEDRKQFLKKAWKIGESNGKDI